MIAISEAYLRKRSQQILIDRTEASQIISESKKHVPALLPTDIQAGRTLGMGSFCIVTALNGINHSSDQHKTEEKIDTNRCSSICHELETKDGKSKYAIKKLIPGLYRKENNFVFAQGVIDLAMEAKYLSVLQHPHIINMRAVADIDGSSKDFFIVIERLFLTLDEKISRWNNVTSNSNQLLRRTRYEKEAFLFGEKLMVGHDICSALAYLHSKKIIYRDLKPNNVGFNEKGDVKLFDFGTATELIEKRRVGDTNTFKLTKQCGTYLYMAPEVYNGRPYNEKCDVYSFALVLWQCLEGEKPFIGYDEIMMRMRVYNGKEVPRFNRGWSASLKSLLMNCLRRDFDSRLSCSEIMNCLKK